ncbi:unnamed protein product [Caenorhabditis bovis]|uniref:RRM domain-containing protein n=1 Tax=Caenorhabditis bovis TaxID=2654633 RepID=A0A8S1EWD0_9PELO|nr:unnamed protein product [Caenorhabditis bovis]
MNRPTSHPEQRLLLVRVSEDPNESHLIVTYFKRLHEEDANNNDTTPSSSSDDVDTIQFTVNITIEEITKFFDEHPFSHIFTIGPEPIRHYLIPLFVRNEQYVPHQLLHYYDILALNPMLQEIENSQIDIKVARRILDLNEEQLDKIHKIVDLEYKSAPITDETSPQINAENVVCRARGLPWQASDQHVAQFFAGLDIIPGGIALCLSSEGRRNGEVLVQFANQESRDLALKRHRNFLLSRYIEVYKATLDEFLHVASGSSSEAMEFLSQNGVIVRMRGLPYDCTDQQIKAFFEPLKPMENILFITRNDGRPTGDAFVQFSTDDECNQALQKHRQTIGQRYIELFKSTAAEVQQVMKRSKDPNTAVSASSSAIANATAAAAAAAAVAIPALLEQQDEKRRDCVRLRGLPYEAQVPHVITFLGEYAQMVKFHGVHMIFNNQGNPSGEAFIQMISEQAALATALAVHNKYMVVGKKKRYIEVFQCAPEDLNLQHLVKNGQAMSQPPVQFLPPPQALIGQQQQQFWTSYPSPPISPIVPGQISQFIVYGLTANITYQDLFNHFSTPEVSVENIAFTRFPSPICSGEALITVRSRQSPIKAPPNGVAPMQAPLLHNYPFPPHQYVPPSIIMEQ